MPVYGQYFKDDKEIAFKPACKSYDPRVSPKSRLKPGSDEIVRWVGISFYLPVRGS
jgi:hypothetical protein